MVSLLKVNLLDLKKRVFGLSKKEINKYMRSSWKGNFFFYKKKVYHKSSTLGITNLSNEIFFHNGKSLNGLLIERRHIGLKLGEFCFTRKIGSIHKKKVNNRKKK